jgi:aspartate/tyrosine/aromatic aminotransferase
MAKTSGFTVKSYRYYHAASKSLDFDGLKADLEVRFSVTLIFILPK